MQTKSGRTDDHFKLTLCRFLRRLNIYKTLRNTSYHVLIVFDPQNKDFTLVG